MADVLRKLGSISCGPITFSEDDESSPGRLMATYPLMPNFTFCKKLDCYVDNIALLDREIPAPHPPPNKKADIFNVEDYADVDERALNAPVRFYKQTLQDLVEYLIEGFDDDLARIRVIYRWITCQPIDSIPMRKEPAQSHTLFQLWRIKNKKGNYAQLVSLLCRYADIPCVIIHGTLKGSTYDVGDEIDEDRHYGEWNAVLINEHWRFINAYWGTCSEAGNEDRTTFNPDPEMEDSNMYYCCDENYFLTDPDQAVATHLPASPRWQLKKKVLTADEFENMTFVKDRYFNLKMRTISHQGCVVRSHTGEVEIKFGLPHRKAIDVDFQYLLFKISSDGTEKRIDRHVFMHRTNQNEHLAIRIRSPDPGVFRFELVGKDMTVRDPSYDYDWIAIYKVIFSAGMSNCTPFPPSPMVGWGPGRVAMKTGLVPLSHFAGEITMDDFGKVEIMFGAADKRKTGEMIYSARLSTGGEDMMEIPDSVVHRVENGDVIFNVMTPQKGEYVLQLFVQYSDIDHVREFCNYLLISKQRDENGPFPIGFQTRIGPKMAFACAGLAPTRPSGFIKTEQDHVFIGFSRTENIDMSVNLSGQSVTAGDAPNMLTQAESGKMVTYTVKLPETGTYGLKIRGSREPEDKEALHEPLYDYVIDFRKIKPRLKTYLTIQQEAESFGPAIEETDDVVYTTNTALDDDIVYTTNTEFDDVDTTYTETEETPALVDETTNITADENQAVLEDTTNATLVEPQTNLDTTNTEPQASLGVDTTNTEPPDPYFTYIGDSIEDTADAESQPVEDIDTPTEDITSDATVSDSYVDILRRRLRMSVEENDQMELRRTLNEMRNLKLASVTPDIKFGEGELVFILIKKELLMAIRDKDPKKLKLALKKARAQPDFNDRMGIEINLAKGLLLRLKKLQKLLHAVLDLDQMTIAEIRGYSKPPVIVHTVMRATLLLLGHWKEETRIWKNIQIVLGKTGKESMKKQISEFKIDRCPLEVALGAKEFLKDTCIEQVRCVSAGCATFFVWVRGVVEELEKRAGEEINNIRPRTSFGKRRGKKRRELTFLRDLDQDNCKP